jgi:hypothetical protein
MDQNIGTFTEGLLTSLTGAMALVFAAIPKILAFIVILVIGWLIAGLIARSIAALLRSVNFNTLAQRSGLSGFVDDMGVTTDASGFIALVAKWFIRLIALVVAFDALGLTAVSDVLRNLLLWLPNLVVALVVLVVGGLLANAFASVVKGATTRAGFENADMLSTLARIAVWSFATIVAVNQLGIATTLVNTLFMGIVGALALAAGLAFGLGGRELAAQKLQEWDTTARKAAPKVSIAAKDMRREVAK